jgi:cation transport ATPase
MAVSESASVLKEESTEENQIPCADSSTEANSADWSLGEESLNESLKTPSTDLKITKSPIKQRQRLGDRASLVLAVSLCITGVVFYVLLTASDAVQPSRLIALFSVTLGGVSVVGVVASLLGGGARGLRPYDALPVVGTCLFTASASTFLMTEIEGAVSAFLASAPVLAGAVLWLGQFMISNRPERSSGRATDNGTSSDPIFIPQSLPKRGEGERFSASKGQSISVDAQIENGSIAIDEKLFSTVASFKIKDEQDIVPAGSVVLSGNADLLALANSENSSAGQLERSLGDDLRAAMNSLPDEDVNASRWTTLLLCFAGLATAVFWNERSDSILAPLLACGTVLMHGAALQMAEYLYSHRRKLVLGALSSGVVVRGASAVRNLSLVEKIEIDPSRLSKGVLPRVTEFRITDDRLEPRAFCNFIISLVGRAESPSLLALADYARHQLDYPQPERVVDLREYPAQGISGTVHGVELSIGSEGFLIERGIMVQPSDLNIEDNRVDNDLLYVAIDDDIVAYAVVVSDQNYLLENADGFYSPEGVFVSLAPGISRELQPNTLLVRGRESDVISVNAPVEEAQFSVEGGIYPSATLVSLTGALEPLLAVVDACKVEARGLERFRVVLGSTGLGVVLAALLGWFWPAVSITSVALIAATLGLSFRRRP